MMSTIAISSLCVYALLATLLWTHAHQRVRRVRADLDLMRHDPVTNLLTRRPWLEHAHHLLARSDEPAVVLCDLNGLKKINDRHSHADGDAVLSQFAHLLRAEFGPRALIGRLGGDEFVVLADASNWDDRPIQTAARACVVHWRGIVCGAAFGIAHARDLPPLARPGRGSCTAARVVEQHRLGRMVHAADLACWQAKLRCHSQQPVTAVETYDPRTYRVPVELHTRPHARARHG